MSLPEPCDDPTCGGLWHWDEDSNTATNPCPVNNPEFKEPRDRARRRRGRKVSQADDKVEDVEIDTSDLWFKNI